MDFNVTGSSLTSQDPMNVYLENITVDISRQGIFFYPLNVFCNYPEAFTHNIVYVKNVTPLISLKKPVYDFSLLNSALPGNHTMIDIDCGGVPVNLQIDICIVVSFRPTCIPDDGILQTIDYDSIHTDGRPQDAGVGNLLILPVITNAAPYRPVHINMTNFDFINIIQNWDYGLFYLYTSGAETAEMTNVKIYNVSCSLFFAEFLVIKDLKIKNLTFENSLDHQGEILKITASGNIELENIALRNYSSHGVSNPPIFSTLFPSTTSMTMRDFSFEDIEIVSASLFHLNSPPAMMTVNNFMFKNCKTPDDQSLLSFDYINSITVSNITLENVNPMSSSGQTEKIIRIGSLNYEEMHTAEFSDITILSSSLSLFGIGSLTALSSSERYISFNNITYSGCNILSTRSLVSTDRFTGDFKLQIQFSKLKFVGIEFAIAGSLIELKHQLPTVVKFEECLISGVNSGVIKAVGRKISSSLNTKVIFVNSAFSNITLLMNPFISTRQNMIIEIENSSFTGFTSMSVIAGILRTSDKSVVTIKNTQFKNNSAIVSSIFRAETEASIICDNCKISNNFGVTNGVFEIESGGVLKIFNSEIFENYAIHYAVGSFLSAFTPSIISETQIYSNDVIFESNLTVELTSSCVRLCFLNDLIKSYLTNLNFTTITQTDTLLQVLLAEVHIVNNTQIYNTTSVVYSLSSVLLVENSLIFDINFVKSPMNLISTEATLSNLTIANCSKLQTQDDIAFIQITSGTLISSNLKLFNSNFKVSQLSFSSGTMTNTQLTNVVNDEGLIKCLKCQKFKLDTLLLINSYSVSNPLLNLQEALNVELINIKLSGYQYKLAQFSFSNITLIQNLEISDGKQTLEFIESNLLKMNNSNFSDNNDDTGIGRGGAIQIFNSKINIENTTFTNNSAYFGGAITFECTSMANCELNIENSKFWNNSAQERGGAIYYNYNYPRVRNTEFIDNKADYGPNFASYPAKIGLANSSLDEDIIVNNIGSGIKIDQILTLALFDMDNQIMNLDNSSQIIILPRNASEASINGFNIVSTEKGIAQFDNIASITNGRILTSNFTLSSKSIKTTKVEEVLGASFRQDDLQINFRDCKPGEIVVGDQCNVCAAGTYSLDWNATECVDCALDADCLGGTQISVRSGYWRRFQNSSKIVECIFKDACIGGFIDENTDDQTSNSKSSNPVKCAQGYHGNLCSQCVVTGDVKYERVNDYECQKCPNQILNSIKVVFTILIVLLFFIFMVVINVRKTDESELSILLRILTNYIQLITVCISMTSDYPAGFLSLAIPMRLFGSSTDSLISFDCFIQDSEIKFIFDSNAIFKLFLMIFLPIALFITIAVMWIIIKLIRPAWCTDMKRALAISFITIIFILHPKLTEKSISMFKCIEIDEGYSVARIDTNIECFSTTHLKWCLIVGAPIIIVWVIACPLIAYIAIHHERGKQNSKTMEYFLMIYQGFRPQVLYWEFVNTLRKIALLLVLLFELKVAINLSLIILLLTARLQIKVKPYKSFENNKIEFLSIMGGVTLIMGALVYTRYEQHNALNTFVFISIIAINIKFLAEWLLILMKLYEDKNHFVRTLAIVLSKIVCKGSQTRERKEAETKSIPKTSEVKKQEKNTKSTGLRKRTLAKSKSIRKKRKIKKRNRTKVKKNAREHLPHFENDEQGIGPLTCSPCVFLINQLPKLSKEQMGMIRLVSAQ
ncbi:unnamed protein product [Moneuplotes crassus]|uniref:Uncharacterized protein n=1 Tax=Euplotes crassus TaxID=5936 RepID=A0AAD1X9D2_EUPCR|nr:unnamed protein product [Moneuplotes crassus]